MSNTEYICVCYIFDYIIMDLNGTNSGVCRQLGSRYFSYLKTLIKQDCVLIPIFSTQNCSPETPAPLYLKFKDDTTVVGLIGE